MESWGVRLTWFDCNVFASLNFSFFKMYNLSLLLATIDQKRVHGTHYVFRTCLSSALINLQTVLYMKVVEYIF